MEIVMKLDNFLCFIFLFAVLAWPCTNYTLFLKYSQSKVSITLFKTQLWTQDIRLRLITVKLTWSARSLFSLLKFPEFQNQSIYVNYASEVTRKAALFTPCSRRETKFLPIYSRWVTFCLFSYFCGRFNCHRVSWEYSETEKTIIDMENF